MEVDIMKEIVEGKRFLYGILEVEIRLVENFFNMDMFLEKFR